MSAGRFLGVFTGSRSCRGSRRSSSRPSRFICALLQCRCSDIHARADKSGRDAIFFCQQIVALLADRNDRNRVRLHFHFQSGLAGDVTQRFAKRNLTECDGDPRFTGRDRRRRDHGGRSNRARGNGRCDTCRSTFRRNNARWKLRGLDRNRWRRDLAKWR